MLKSKEFAAQQREQARKKALEKKEKGKRREERDSKAQPEALVRTHAVTFKQNVDIKAPIDEADAESEYSHQPVTQENEEQKTARQEYERKNNFIMMYKLIDQSTLCEIGLKSKTSLGEDSIEDIHGFSMLQRFRGDRDLNAFDRSKPVVDPASDESDSEESEEEAGCENINLRNLNPEQKPATALNAAREQKKVAKMIQVKEERVPEFKWWVGGDPNAAERHA